MPTDVMRKTYARFGGFVRQATIAKQQRFPPIDNFREGKTCKTRWFLEVWHDAREGSLRPV